MTAWKDKRYPAQPLQYVANAAQACDLIQSGATKKIRCRLTGNLQISAGTTDGTLLAEALLRLIRWFRITENGKPTHEWDSRALIALYNREHEHAAHLVMVPDGSVQGPSAVEADFSIDFCSRLIANSYETHYRVVDTSKKFQVEVEWESDPKTQMVTGSDRTWAFTSVQLEVEQYFDDKSTVLPVYVPRLRRTQSGQILGAGTKFEFDLKMSARSRGLLIHTLSDNLTDGGVITGNLSIEGADVYWKAVDPVMAFEEEQGIYPGVDRQPGYYFVNFCEGGRLSNAFDPAQDGQLKLVADVNKGAGTVGIIRVYDLQLVGLLGVTRVLDAAHPLR